MRRGGLLLLAVMIGCTPAEPPAPDPSAQSTNAGAAPGGVPERAPVRCRDWSAEKNVYFGDLHVHTALSMDAWSVDTRVGLDEAYRFARGETIHLAPLDAEGRSTRPVSLERPLDFAAVTDHVEFLGELEICGNPAREGYESSFCRDWRGTGGSDDMGVRNAAVLRLAMDPNPKHVPEICGEDGARCVELTQPGWQQIQAAAARWDEGGPDCGFRTFVAYEWGAHPRGANLHRNVVFRTSAVPAHPTGYVDANTTEKLWDTLQRDCIDAGNGCDVLAIPHNSNISRGLMFALDALGEPPEPGQREAARVRQRMEPLVEIMQHKGDSECRNGLDGVAGPADPECDFEKLRVGAARECTDENRYEPVRDWGCVARTSFARYALVEGLKEQARIGVNPLKLGFVASTDTHNGIPGAVDEYAFPGAFGVLDATPEARLSAGRPPGDVYASPGGLVAVWAEENSREALFDAMRRRETYGTSGPRLTARFFGGWDLDPALCDDPDRLARAYEQGVPMGGDLPSLPADAGAPVFVAWAARDPGTAAHPGQNLERIQIVKGWVGEDDVTRQQVYEIAGAALKDSVDPATCAPNGAGATTLCSVWSDPDFDPAANTVYYARVLEAPSCRWSARQCLALPAAERPAGCAQPDVPKTVRERAWTSPIWFQGRD